MLKEKIKTISEFILQWYAYLIRIRVHVVAAGAEGFLTTYRSLHIVAHSLSVVVTSWTRGSSVGMTVSFCLQTRKKKLYWLCFDFVHYLSSLNILIKLHYN